jgi:acyl-CoA thioester hydrolase
MQKHTDHTFIWHSTPEPADIDIQQIVNNAAYLKYFDHARREYLLTKDVDWEAWHHRGYNLVLIHVDMAIKHSLKLDDKFSVTSRYEKAGRLKIIFHQEIHRDADNKLIAQAVNTIVCVSIKTGRPVMPEELAALL